MGCQKDGMIALYRNKCACGQSANFSETGKAPPTHCAKCRTSDMTVTSKKCQVCNISPVAYRVKEGEPLTHCKSCRLPEMIPKQGMCKECGLKPARYGLEKDITHCRGCKTSKMTQNIGCRKCEVCRNKQCKFGLEDGKPVR
jgi:hypothetical protein